MCSLDAKPAGDRDSGELKKFLIPNHYRSNCGNCRAIACRPDVKLRVECDIDARALETQIETAYTDMKRRLEPRGRRTSNEIQV